MLPTVAYADANEEVFFVCCFYLNPPLLFRG
jgi:hypothetical protein